MNLPEEMVYDAQNGPIAGLSSNTHATTINEMGTEDSFPGQQLASSNVIAILSVVLASLP